MQLDLHRALHEPLSRPADVVLGVSDSNKY